MNLTLPYAPYEIAISQESPNIPRHTARSTDNAVASDVEVYIGKDDGYRPSSRHRVTIRRAESMVSSRVLLAGGGASGIHMHSAFVHINTCFIAVGPFVCALELPTLRLLWHSRSDAATCFGVYHAPKLASIISHGELEIARLTYSGQVLWSASGKDIFSEAFRLREHFVDRPVERGWGDGGAGFSPRGALS